MFEPSMRSLSARRSWVFHPRRSVARPGSEDSARRGGDTTQSRFIELASIMIFSLFGTKATASNEETFWKWFVANEPRLFAFESDREPTFDALTKQLNRVNGDLTFEFGPITNGKREFVISAGGIKAAFPAVEALYSKAPSLPRWIWVKFRPRRLPINDLEYDGKKVRVDDVRYLLAKDGDKVGVVLFFDGYNEAQKGIYGQMGYLFLDEALGEYVVETQVGFIEFQSRASRHFGQSHPLEELPRDFDNYIARLVH